MMLPSSPSPAVSVANRAGRPSSDRSARLAGKVAIITGGAGDIGSAIARHFLQAGAAVALLDRRSTALDATAARLAPQEQLQTLVCDVADATQVETAVQSVVARWRRVDILVNNAAAETPSAPIARADIGDWRHALDVNLTGAWLLCRSCVPHMVTGGGGVVLGIASQLGQVAGPGRGAYGVSKAGLIALMRAVAVDHAAEGIRAVSLSPGAIVTSRLTDRYDGADEAARHRAPRYPLGRIGTADEVAAAALFLAGDEASFVTGTDLLVDGGYTAV